MRTKIDFGSCLVSNQRLFVSAAIVMDQLIREFNNLSCAAIVVLKPNNLGSRKLLLEPENVLHFSSAPTVNRLIIITHYAQIAMWADKRRDDLELHLVRVLILVDLHMIESILAALQYLWKLIEQLRGQQQQVIEIDGTSSS